MNDNQGRKKSSNLLKDDRFKALFTNPEFEVDKHADEYKMLTPVLSRLEKGKVKELKRKVESTAMPYMDEDEKVKSSDDDLFSEKDEDEEMQSSDDDDRTWEKDLKQTYRQIRKDHKAKELADDGNSSDGESDADTKPTVNNPNSTSSISNGKTLEFKVRNITGKANR